MEDNFSKAYSVFVALLVFTFLMSVAFFVYKGTNDTDKIAGECVDNNMQWVQDDAGRWECYK